MTLKPDCRHFPGDRPCRFNKEQGLVCDDCDHYTPKGIRILIIKLAALGDVLRTTCLLPALKAEYPSSYVVWMTESESVELLQNNPFIDEIWTPEPISLARLHVQAFDLIINVDADKGSCALARIAQMTANRALHSNDLRGFILNINGDVMATSNAAKRWLEMGAFDQLKLQNKDTYQKIIHAIAGLDYGFPNPLPEPILALTKEETDQAAELCDAGCETIVGINLGGGGRWKKKQWKLEHYLALCRRLFLQPGIITWLFGGRQESSIIAQLCMAFAKHKLPRRFEIRGPNLSARQFAAAIGRCNVLVTGDTLGLHIATALKVSTVVLLGPTSAAELELYGRGIKIVAPIGCAGCYLPDCDINPDCMKLIEPKLVFRETMALIECEPASKICAPA